MISSNTSFDSWISMNFISFLWLTNTSTNVPKIHSLKQNQNLSNFTSVFLGYPPPLWTCKTPTTTSTHLKLDCNFLTLPRFTIQTASPSNLSWNGMIGMTLPQNKNMKRKKKKKKGVWLHTFFFSKKQLFLGFLPHFWNSIVHMQGGWMLRFNQWWRICWIRKCIWRIFLRFIQFASTGDEMVFYILMWHYCPL